MLEISNSIKTLDDSDIGDNLFYYPYSIRHIVSLQKNNIDQESGEYLSAYRSFEGEVFENFMYEKLIRYAQNHPDITDFIRKGPHAKPTQALPDTLSVNSKGQIVYRTRNNEIGEFDSLIFAGDILYFVEMTLVKSITKLKRRLRKKKALLESIFPRNTIKALIILNEGATGMNMFPDYCTVWLTKPYTSAKIFDRLKNNPKQKRKPFEAIESENIIEATMLRINKLNYYGSLSWILKTARASKHTILDMKFLKDKKTTRFIDLYTKIYIGVMTEKEFLNCYPDFKGKLTDEIIVSIEKEHTDALVLTYFVSHSRKNLDNIVIKDGVAKAVKKDPFGITVTEVKHMQKAMEYGSYHLTCDEISTIERLLAIDNKNSLTGSN